ncbi:MAG: ABC transporter ATP-binding protein, partial [Deltaproteobacteria bacterium]|nr:ABC transporter ATP-binding protein [Deltaproteobacteria bacterium]
MVPKVKPFVAPESPPESTWLSRSLGVFRYSKGAIELVWTTSRKLTFSLAALTLSAGLLPAGIAFVGKLIVDAVLHAQASGAAADQFLAVQFILVEAALLVVMAGLQRAIDLCQSLLRALLGQRVNEMILEKALTLDLAQFEDSELYDMMTRARRQASTRPLSLVMKTFGLVQNSIALATYGALLFQLSGLAVAVLVVAALPAFYAETKYSGEAFRLFSWRTPEKREQNYLEMVLAREDFAKEVSLYGIGPLLLKRYRAIFEKLFDEDKSLAVRRGFWGWLLGLISTASFYAAYIWIALQTIYDVISLGEMTMYLLVFRQGQGAVQAILRSVGGMYDDNLYLSNLHELMAVPTRAHRGHQKIGPKPGDGIRFVNVGFTYPDAPSAALEHVNLHIAPGEKLALVGENGSGKTTLIKLLSGLYSPSDGVISLDGLSLEDWDPETLRARIGVIFQDFVRYQFTVGENVGSGDVSRFDDRERWQQASDKGMAMPFIEELPDGFDTQLGRWFKNGRELSIGQWQKIALSRAFMREDADLLVFDEPTSAMDAEAEAKIFDRVKALTANQMAILISHRFSHTLPQPRVAVPMPTLRLAEEPGLFTQVARPAVPSGEITYPTGEVH